MSSLTMSHRFPIELPEGIDPAQAVAVEFDGGQVDGDQLLYGVLRGEDVRKVPSDLIETLLSNQEEIEGFFVGTEGDFSLYFDADHIPEIERACADVGLQVLTRLDQLHMMSNIEGDLTAPDVPAFVEMGQDYMDHQVALSLLADSDPGLNAGLF